MITPLQTATKKGYVDIVKMLIIGGAQIDAKNSFGWTTLHFAAKYNQSMILEMLLKNGASVEVQNSIGATPLHIATCQNSVEISIHKGAKIDAKTQLD